MDWETVLWFGILSDGRINRFFGMLCVLFGVKINEEEQLCCAFLLIFLFACCLISVLILIEDYMALYL